MVTQQPYHLYAQHSKGTLVTGQTISVNKYTVRVEQYLSQGEWKMISGFFSIWHYNRWLCAGVLGSNADSCLQHYASCTQTYRRCQWIHAHRSEERGWCHGAYSTFFSLGSIHAISQRLLRGHPNIVYLIDAAWAKMPSGAFEVYILMEYCPGLLTFVGARPI